MAGQQARIGDVHEKPEDAGKIYGLKSTKQVSLVAAVRKVLQSSIGAELSEELEEAACD